MTDNEAYLHSSGSDINLISEAELDACIEAWLSVQAQAQYAEQCTRAQSDLQARPHTGMDLP